MYSIFDTRQWQPLFHNRCFGCGAAALLVPAAPIGTIGRLDQSLTITSAVMTRLTPHPARPEEWVCMPSVGAEHLCSGQPLVYLSDHARKTQEQDVRRARGMYVEPSWENIIDAKREEREPKFPLHRFLTMHHCYYKKPSREWWERDTHAPGLTLLKFLICRRCFDSVMKPLVDSCNEQMKVTLQPLFRPYLALVLLTCSLYQPLSEIVYLYLAFPISDL